MLEVESREERQKRNRNNPRHSFAHCCHLAVKLVEAELERPSGVVLAICEGQREAATSSDDWHETSVATLRLEAVERNDFTERLLRHATLVNRRDSAHVLHEEQIHFLQILNAHVHGGELLPDERSQVEIEWLPRAHCNAQKDSQELKLNEIVGR